MILLGEGLKWKLILVRLVIVLIFMQGKCMVAPDVPLASKLFWMHLMVLLGDEAQVKAHFGSFGERANLDAR
jgi:hypothetical protein